MAVVCVSGMHLSQECNYGCPCGGACEPGRCRHCFGPFHLHDKLPWPSWLAYVTCMILNSGDG